VPDNGRLVEPTVAFTRDTFLVGSTRVVRLIVEQATPTNSQEPSLMSSFIVRHHARWLISGWALVLFGVLAAPVSAQNNNANNNNNNNNNNPQDPNNVVAVPFIQTRQVGGMLIEAGGVLQNVEVDQLNQLRQERARALEPASADLNEPTPLRKVSLKKLEAAIAAHLKNGRGPLPDEVRYLGGLQRIRYVFVYPEQGDIVLAGPGEGWKVNHEGAVVGSKSGLPVLQLEDLLVALRTASPTNNEVISCSIEPTEEGRRRLEALQISQMGKETLNLMEQQMGPQNIIVTGVPGTSRFAQVLVSADYRMKRIAMKFDPSPVKGLPSYLDMASPTSASQTPRWWMSTNYDPLLKDAEGLAWELRGQGVKAMTEEDVFVDGVRQKSGKANPQAQKWADLMTQHFSELAARDTVFGELRNCMDLAIVSALISRENLSEKAGYSMSLLLNNGELAVSEYEAPKTVHSMASAVKKRRNWIISVSGGVELDSFGVAGRQAVDAALAPVRADAIGGQNQGWWWN